jgi:hypothetical protein
MSLPLNFALVASPLLIVSINKLLSFRNSKNQNAGKSGLIFGWLKNKLWSKKGYNLGVHKIINPLSTIT